MNTRQLDRQQLVEEIRRFNTTVDQQFLEQFSETELAEYLDHLDAARRKQLQISGWVKPRTALRRAS
ncbi:MAG: hypothetical protein QM770_20965 [Tepidisphaeraceae bacterium]